MRESQLQNIAATEASVVPVSANVNNRQLCASPFLYSHSISWLPQREQLSHSSRNQSRSTLPSRTRSAGCPRENSFRILQGINLVRPCLLALDQLVAPERTAFAFFKESISFDLAFSHSISWLPQREQLSHSSRNQSRSTLPSRTRSAG